MALPDTETLIRHYCTEQMTLEAIAKRYRCRKATVVAALDAAGQSRRSGRRRTPLPAWMADATMIERIKQANYGEEGLRVWLRNAGVNQRKVNRVLGMEKARRKRGVDDEDVRTAYDAGTPVQELAVRYGCTRRTIGRSLDRTCPVAQRSGNEGDPIRVATRIGSPSLPVEDMSSERGSREDGRAARQGATSAGDHHCVSALSRDD
jgi:hypothetical protein